MYMYTDYSIDPYCLFVHCHCHYGHLHYSFVAYSKSFNVDQYTISLKNLQAMMKTFILRLVTPVSCHRFGAFVVYLGPCSS